MLQRRIPVGKSFDYRDPDTGKVVRVSVLEIRHGGQVVLGIEAPEGVNVALSPRASEADAAAVDLDPGPDQRNIPVEEPAD